MNSVCNSRLFPRGPVLLALDLSAPENVMVIRTGLDSVFSDFPFRHVASVANEMVEYPASLDSRIELGRSAIIPERQSRRKKHPEKRSTQNSRCASSPSGTQSSRLPKRNLSNYVGRNAPPSVLAHPSTCRNDRRASPRSVTASTAARYSRRILSR